MNDDFEALKKEHYRQAREKYYQLSQLLERIIDRIYPEKDAKQLKNNLYPIAYIATAKSDAEEQKEFCDDIDMKINVIKTILEEYELFGFDDFKPVKEKVETEAGIKAGIFNLSRKKTREK